MKTFKRNKQREHNLMESTNEKISHGAADINKCIPKAHGDNWRRKEVLKKSKK